MAATLKPKSFTRTVAGVGNKIKREFKKTFTDAGAGGASYRAGKKKGFRSASEATAAYDSGVKKASRNRKIAAGVGVAAGAGMAAGAYNKRQEDKKFKNRVKDRLGIRR